MASIFTTLSLTNKNLYFLSYWNPYLKKIGDIFAVAKNIHINRSLFNNALISLDEQSQDENKAVKCKEIDHGGWGKSCRFSGLKPLLRSKVECLSWANSNNGIHCSMCCFIDRMMQKNRRRSSNQTANKTRRLVTLFCAFILLQILVLSPCLRLIMLHLLTSHQMFWKIYWQILKN